MLFTYLGSLINLIESHVSTRTLFESISLENQFGSLLQLQIHQWLPRTSHKRRRKIRTEMGCCLLKKT